MTSPPSAEQIVEQLEPWLMKHRRPVWKPLVKEEGGPLTGSKFSGTPYLAADEKWPACKTCDRPLELFLQLNLGQVPSELRSRFGQGLLQLFYCRHTGFEDRSCDCGTGWKNFTDDCKLVRVVYPEEDVSPPTLPNGIGAFPAKSIIGWERTHDVPVPLEQEELGLHYLYDSQTGAENLHCPELHLMFRDIDSFALEEAMPQCLHGDKLAGWPCWVQTVEYPECPRCEQPMTYLMQLESRQHLPFEFGDGGAGHVFRCSRHPEVVSFGWASF